MLYSNDDRHRTELCGAVKFIDRLTSGFSEQTWTDLAHERLGTNQPEPGPTGGTQWMEPD